MKIVFLDRATLSPETTLRRPGFAHELVCHEGTAPSEVAERIADADIVIVNKVKIGAEALQRAARLKLVAVAATGTDCIDLEACAARGITVSNVRNYAAHTVPEHTFALIFALRRSICAYRDSVKAGRWQESGQFCYFDYPIRDLAGSTLGIIGDGALGSAVAAIARALGMQVLMAAHKGRAGMGRLYTPFEEVLARADILTLHCPLTPRTRHMIGAAEFAQMARKPLLINTARGGLVDEAALAAALRSGRIAGAGFDVVSAEPPAADHPFMALLELPNFILTPHVAWASQEAIQGLADQLVDNIEAFAAGRAVNVVA
ncbi:D-2-hydroxyacid dehydrogenase [Comamonas endophytica]|uniref:D-2-hydroxyacid dehydrogenase n=1 Tax=Comamonas endophytica TaxID=2949090 RepID=A0ABY6GEQ4_9BURK|nr:MULTISPECIES: D-2-hydroxyacid dehydrogenase [unclassified Acidovorax]MCD2514329.1 D-2-hydroxyacid dehydrogenase [Acidovorax sp. D4N7]UYG53578.1 D-2-hydroxyacid dehydrogenase [Acidovorax sp. 5MLIR]